MTDDLPSSTPEKSGDDKSAANKTNHQGKTNPEKKNSPRKPRTKKWFGLSETKWREIAGIAVLIPWVWNEFLDTHNFTKLCLLAVTISVAQGATLTFFKSRWRGFILALWLISLVPVAGVVWQNSRPEPKPHFSLLLNVSTSPKNVLYITNDLFTSGSLASMQSSGYLLIPVSARETNVVLQFMIDNDSTIAIENAQPALIIPDTMTGLFDSVDSNWFESDLFTKNGIKTFAGAPFPIILPDSVQELPELKFENGLGMGQSFFMSVGLEGKNLPKTLVSFWLAFIPLEYAGFSEPRISFRRDADFWTNSNGHIFIAWPSNTFMLRIK
jgi:hypothetical protein